MAADPILSSALNTINLDEIKREMGPPPWARQVVLSEYVLGTAICQTAAVTTDNHVHDYDEWWLVLEGEIHWLIEGRAEPVRAKAGDFIFVPALTNHHILPQGDDPLDPAGGLDARPPAPAHAAPSARRKSPSPDPRRHCLA